MSFLRHKSVRLAVWYVLLCALAFGWARSERYALCSDWRFAALRELMKPWRPDSEVLFYGSSRTARGVVPEAFEAELIARGGPELRSLNLAVSGKPRHVNYLQLVDYLRDHEPPKVVFVEVGTFDDLLAVWPHQVLPRFMDFRDALRVAWRRPYLLESQKHAGRVLQAGGDIYADGLLRKIDRSGRQIELALGVLGRGPEDTARTLFNGLRNGWDAWQAQHTWAAARAQLANPYWAAPPEPPVTPETVQQQLDSRGWHRVGPERPEAKAGREKVIAKAGRVSLDDALRTRSTEAIDDSARYRAMLLYSKLLIELCDERGIRLVFMFLPGFRDNLTSPSQQEFYESRSELFQPDFSVLWREENYQDAGHLTIEGAREFSAQLARYLVDHPLPE